MSRTDSNNHLVIALANTQDYGIGSAGHDGISRGYIKVQNNNVSFNIQNGPVKQHGRNGCDATDIIRYAIGLYRSFNKAHPCRENALTLTKLEEALHWQDARTTDRESRKVEGTDKN